MSRILQLTALFFISFLILANCKKKETAKLPDINTESVSEISSISATSGGEITKDGGERIETMGIVWSTNQEPTIEHHMGITVDTIKIDSSENTVFKSSLTGLSENTRYYVKAYAVNSAGTAYGNQHDFQTLCHGSPATVVDVTNPLTGKTWMDRNLGAERVALDSIDEYAYGELYQWGRAADGHQCRNTTRTTSTLSSSIHPDHNNFIIVSESPWDWRSNLDTNLWQGLIGINNPCPKGYRLPTGSEWEEEMESWTQKNAKGAFNSPLKLPMVGSRYGTVGLPISVGTIGRYWSSTMDGTGSQSLSFSRTAAGMYNGKRADGHSVRCIKN